MKSKSLYLSLRYGIIVQIELNPNSIFEVKYMSNLIGTCFKKSTNCLYSNRVFYFVCQSVVNMGVYAKPVIICIGSYLTLVFLICKGFVWIEHC